MPLNRRGVRALLALGVAASLLAPPAPGAELKLQTAAAFDTYIQATEARMLKDLSNGQFLLLDRLPKDRQQSALALLHRGEPYILQVQTSDAAGQPFMAPSGLIHHWTGIIFIPGASLAKTTSQIEDYNNQQYIFKPEVQKSKLLERNGEEFKVYLQFLNKTVVSVVVNGLFDVKYSELSDGRGLVRSYSTRIAEVRNFNRPDERELPVGRDRGFMWRLNSYWRMEQKDGGTYLEIEVISLSRSIPPVIATLVDPVVSRVSRSYVARLLNGTRNAIAGGGQLSVRR